MTILLIVSSFLMMSGTAISNETNRSNSVSNEIANRTHVTYRFLVDNDNGFRRLINITANKEMPNDNRTLRIYIGDSITWVNFATPDIPLTIVSDQNLWKDKDGLLKWNYKQFTYTFNKSGNYAVYIRQSPRLKHQNIMVDPIIKPTPSPTPTPTPSPTPTSTPVQTPNLSKNITKSAILDINYTVVNNGKMIVNVTVKNIGNATASLIDMRIGNPKVELGDIKGGNKSDYNITWQGDLKPNKRHYITFSVDNAENNGEKGLIIPLRVRYSKLSLEEKAKILGINQKPDKKILTSRDWRTASSSIRINKQTPGFEPIMTIFAILSIIYILRKNRNRI